jgi:hypothetical protein
MQTRQERATAEAEINQLVQRYAHAVDIRGPEAQAACFTADGFLEFPGLRRDRSQIAAGYPSGGIKRRHFFTPPLITFTSPETATGEGYCLILDFDEAAGKDKPSHSVDYRDAYRATADGWLLEERVIRHSFP